MCAFSIVWTALALASGCATDPLSQLETVTPTLTPAQGAELRQRAQTPEALGIRMKLEPHGASFSGVNEMSAGRPVTVRLVKIPTETPREPGGLYRVPVILATVNGRSGVRVLLDSGSNRNLFGYSLARSLKIPIVEGVGPITSYGIGGAVENYLALVPSMQIESLEFRKVMALVGPDAQALTFTRSFWGDTQVMILGVNLLRQFSYLTVDHLRGTMTLAPQDSYLPDETSKFVTAAPLRWSGDLPAVDITVDGRHQYSCILDTGGDYGMLVPRSKAAELGYWKPGRGALTASRGIGGASLTTTYQIRQAKVGEATFTRIPARTDVVGPEPARDHVLLGNMVLRRYRVTFDFKNDVLWLER